MKILNTKGCSRNFQLLHRKYLIMKQTLPTTVNLLFLTFLILPTLLSATILTVKQDGTGDFTVIQEACFATSPGDTVLVYPGRYYENITLKQSMNLTLASLYLTTLDRSFIQNTIIDGNQTGSCIFINNTSINPITVEGFTLTNGSGHPESARGGGMYIKNASAVSIISNIITNNSAAGGGGILVSQSDIFLSDNLICHNRAFSVGGGIYNLYESQILFDPVHKNSVFLNYAPKAMDIGKISYSEPMDIILDTCTVLNPDYYFIYSFDVFNFPNNDISISVEHGKIEPVNHDLYVNPATGDDTNDGLTPETALKTVSWACTKIASDSNNPLNIYLMDGIYSPSTNQERFPFNGRSNVSLLGESMENTIFDADSSYYFYKSSGMQTGFSIKNITMQNAYEGDLPSMTSGGMYFQCCVSASLNNITIKNCHQNSRSGIGFDYPDALQLKDITFDNLKGGGVLGMGNTFAPGKTFRCENIAIKNCRPDDNPMQTMGDGFGISLLGSLYIDDLFSGSFINLQITDNLRIPDPGWGPGTVNAFAFSYRAKVNLINATIGNNTCRGDATYAAAVDNGSIVNLYNTIMYGDSLKEFSLGSPTGSYFSATANISYSNFEGGEAAIKNWQNMHTLNWLEGNMDEDPRWMGTGDTAYYLQYNSPCRNSGTPMYETGMSPPYIKEEDGRYVLYMHNMDTVHLPATDLAGRPRISGNRIDMGAYEYQDTGVSVQEYGQTQDAFQLAVYPNPFYVHAFVDFKMENQGHVQIVISDMNGQRVKTLLDATMPRGDYHLIWKGDNDYGTTLKTGTYLLTFYNNQQKVTTVKVQKQRF